MIAYELVKWSRDLDGTYWLMFTKTRREWKGWLFRKPVDTRETVTVTGSGGTYYGYPSGMIVGAFLCVGWILPVVRRIEWGLEDAKRVGKLP